LAVVGARAQFPSVPINPEERAWYRNSLLRADSAMHTGFLPWRESEVQRFDRRQSLRWADTIGRSALFRSLFFDHALQARDTDYWFTLNPVVDFSVGTDAFLDDTPYINGRGVTFEAHLTDHWHVTSTAMTAQVRFPRHVNDFVRANRVAPGWWLAKSRDYEWDVTYVAGEVAYTPNRIFHLYAGHGKHHVGDGYRSMFLSDAGMNYPFLRLETSFWKFRYINLWAVMNDIRPEVAVDGVFAKKYMSFHLLSFQPTPRFNFTVVEGIMWGDELRRYGFDINFFNPFIFYRPLEFAQGFTGGNAMMGAQSSYRFRNGLMVYGQFMFDEFTFSTIRNWREQDWRTMFAGQVGAQWGDAFGVDNLYLRGELNVARPYTYSHRKVLTNWAHYAQPLAHPWGGNFREGLLQAQYRWRRVLIDGAYHYGVVGRDVDSVSYGNNVYVSFDQRVGDTGIQIGQGSRGHIRFWRVAAAYVVNPTYNLQVGLSYQHRSETTPDAGWPDSRAFLVSLRSNVYRVYQDF